MRGLLVVIRDRTRRVVQGLTAAGTVFSIALMFFAPGLALPLSQGEKVLPGTSLAQGTVIPFGNKPVKVDGVCDPKEYKDALASSFVDGGGSTGVVYLKHTHTFLEICMQGAQGSYPQRFASVYLDPELSGGAVPQPTDLALRVDFNSSQTSSMQGGGIAGYFTPVALGGWSASAQANGSDTAEFRIPLTLVGCRDTFGLAVYHHWFAGISNDYGWPASQFWDQPQTWATVVLDKFHAQQCSINLLGKRRIHPPSPGGWTD